MWFNCFLIFMCVVTTSAHAQSAFEQTFIREAAARKRVSADAVASLIRPLPSTLLEPTLNGSPDEMLQQLDQLFAPWTATQIFQTVRPSIKTTPVFDTKDPLTIVIFPGVFGEFIETRAFEEAFRQGDSMAARQWRTVMDRRPPCVTGEEIYCDRHLELRSMDFKPGSGHKAASLGDLIQVTSLDSADGRPLVRLVLFNTPTMSLESMGTIESKAELMTRRFEKYLRLTGRQRLAFLGYSRGAAIALEALARAKKNQAPWLQDVEAMVSLGGVNFGSSLADDAINAQHSIPAPAVSQQLQLLRKMTADLEYMMGPSSQENQAVFQRNLERIAQALSAALDLQSSNSSEMTSPLTTLLNQFDMVKGVAWPSFVPLMLKLGVGYGFLPSLEDLWQGHFEFWSGATYNLNTYRFKILMAEAFAAIEQLSTPARLEWWRTHTLPLEHVRYLSITGTLDGSRTSGYGQYMNRHPELFDMISPDAQTLLTSYEQLTKSSGLRLNDGQVAVPRAMFWPRLISALNPQNEGMHTTHLGLFGVHHWGLALQVASRNWLGSTNPFPRRALLLGIAAELEFNTKK